MKLKRNFVRILEALSTPCIISFEMSSQLLQLVSAFTFLRFTDSYWSEVVVSGTRLFKFEWFVAMISLISTIYVFTLIVLTAFNKGWWGLHTKLKAKRKWYKQIHLNIMRQTHYVVKD